MRLSIFGLGYVGTVSAACLTSYGHTVIGVDTNPLKVDSICKGESPVVEPGVDELLRRGVAEGRLSATTDPQSAVLGSECSLLCVGTPSRSNGSLSLDQVFAVGRQIGKALKDKPGYHAVALRSTVLPGTLGRLAAIIEEVSGKKLGEHFSVASNPEFLREGTALADFERPPFTIIGASDARIESLMRELYAPVTAPFINMEIRAAELLKYACNSFHALKVAFANEIGAISKQLGVDSHEVMKVFAQDTKLNISPYYLMPGFAFGGSCLPKDVRALSYQAKLLDVSVPVVSALMESNERHVQRVIDWVLDHGKKRIGVLGLSFKSDTDDMRESPVVRVIETLLGKGYDVAIYDSSVNLSRLIGANKRYIEQEIPHISSHLKNSIDEVLDCSDILLIANKSAEFKKALESARRDQVVFDLVRLVPERSNEEKGYEGLCW